MDLLTKMAETCKSPKDISILNRLLDTAYSDNTIQIDNVTMLAEEYEVARSKLNGLLKAFEKAGLFKKLDRGIYFINPFIFVGKRVKSNELREVAQQKWRSI
jgi:predicted transcriptional regulator of viral defense system